MPELPEVQTIVSELDRKLKNRIIKSVTVNAPKMVAVGPGVVSNRRQVESYSTYAKASADKKVIKFIKLLWGKKFLSVKRRAKLLIFNLSRPSAAILPSPRLRRAGGTPSPYLGEGKKVRATLSLLVHLKMTGQFIFEDVELRKKTGGKYRMFNKPYAPLVELPSKHTHIIFKFTDGATLYFNDIRKFGYMKLVRDDELDKVKELNEFGPEPLDKKFTSRVFLTAVKNTRQRKIKIKQLLMEPKFVAGIGNIYSDEILFHAGVRPTRQVLSIKNEELRKIYKWIKLVLIKGIKAKGSSVGDFVRTDGSWGTMGKYHFVYGRKGQKCKKCGDIIEAVKLGGRTASYCPKCQV